VERVQEIIGQAAIQSIGEFARRDIDSVQKCETSLFAFVKDPILRRSLSEAFYGARWLYKLGFCLQVTDVESRAHVRVQITEYGAITEALLKYGLVEWTSMDEYSDWRSAGYRSFYDSISDAATCEAIPGELATRLHRLRKDRNAIHISPTRIPEAVYVRARSKAGMQVVLDTAEAVRIWQSRQTRK
jgi:hypothetical protein